MAQLVKNLPAVQQTTLQFLGREDPLEKGQATHSRIHGLAWWLSWGRIRLQCGRPGFDPWIGNIPWRRKWQPLQYSRLENPVDGGAWSATAHGVAKIWTRLSDLFLSLFSGNSLAVQWLGLCALTAEGPGSVLGEGTKIPEAVRH